jgi:hypothetical protein
MLGDFVANIGSAFGHTPIFLNINKILYFVNYGAGGLLKKAPPTKKAARPMSIYSIFPFCALRTK